MLADLLPPGVEVAERHGPPVTVPLFADEEQAVAQAVPARRAEYAAVRGCAREALTRLGVTTLAVPSDPKGAPVWPAGVVGSMTHGEGYRAAVVGRADEWAGLGVDAEPRAPLPPEVAELVLDASERAPLADLDPHLCADRVLFSAKESAYKVWSPITGVWLGFEDVRVHLDEGTFVVRLLRPDLGVDELRGRWAVADDLRLTAIALPRRPAPRGDTRPCLDVRSDAARVGPSLRTHHGSDMDHVEIFVLAAAAVLVAALSRHRGWPAPLVVVAVGLAVSLVPGVPRYEVDSELLLEFVLPPLLYSAALSSSYRDFRAQLNSITRLGVGLVAVTALAVALVFSLLDEVSFAAALVLGAVVAPPDAVAAAAVGRRLGLPRRVMTVLSGESLINDATSLTLYKVALAGVASGAWALGSGLWTFALAVVAGVGVGLALAVVVHLVRTHLDDAVVASAIGILTPFAAYWSAEAVHGSGVLAVVAAGLYLGHTSPRAGYATRLYEEPIWSTLDLVLESFTFALIGVQLPWVVRDLVESDQGLGHGVVVSLVVLVVTVLVRPLYLFATAWVDDIRLPGSHRPPGDSLTPRESAVVSWAGMRGVVTLAAAAAIPSTIDGAPFEHRATIQLAAYTVALGTLLLQGPSLPWLIRRLGIGSAQEEADDARQEAAMRVATADAVQEYFAEQRPRLAASVGEERAGEVVERLSKGWRARATAAAVMLDPASADELGLDVSGRLGALGVKNPTSAAAGRKLQAMRRKVIAVQREVLMEHRDAGDLDEAVMRRMMRELDLEEEALEASWVSRLRD